MTSVRDKFAITTTILAVAVADNGTFEMNYPAGTTQAGFVKGLLADNSYIIFDDNDRWALADPGFSLSFGASVITVTNLTGASLPVLTKVTLHLNQRDSRARIPLTVPLPPLSTITAADIVTSISPGVDGRIEYVEFVTTVAATTASKAATLNLEIGTTNLTGGEIALTSAAVTPKGKVIAGSEITGANRINREDTLSIEASSVTAFVEGEGFLIVYIRPSLPDMY